MAIDISSFTQLLSGFMPQFSFWDYIMIAIVFVFILNIILIIITFIVMWKTLKFVWKILGGLIDDYFFDCVLSFVDEIWGGGIGLDWGDLIGGIIIFFRNKDKVGIFWSLIIVWEAFDFTPVNFIPVIGGIVEVITNLFPCATICRLLFGKWKAADREAKKIERNLGAARDAKIDTSDAENALNENLPKIAKKPLVVYKKLKKVNKELSEKLSNYVNNLISELGDAIERIEARYKKLASETSIPEDVTAIMQKGIDNSEALMENAKESLKKEEYAKAVESVKSAQNVLESAGQQFDDAFAKSQEED
ncbi:MAG: hypothetical protein N3D84_03850 [Candidatus Woesearchaeota archaeon]|nr:hypothetical protein [Candidatus Woesearchaeota archaeon]